MISFIIERLHIPLLYLFIVLVTLAPFVSSTEHEPFFSIATVPSEPTPTGNKTDAALPLPTDFSSAAFKLAILQGGLPTPFVDALASLTGDDCVESALASLNDGKTPSPLHAVMQTVSVDMGVIQEMHSLISVVEMQSAVPAPDGESDKGSENGVAVVVPGLKLTTTSITTLTVTKGVEPTGVTNGGVSSAASVMVNRAAIHMAMAGAVMVSVWLAV